MNFYDDPNAFQKFLSDKRLIDDIYNSIKQKDKGVAVVTALEILMKTKKLPVIRNDPKHEGVSIHFRKLGDKACEEEDYKKALYFYNAALRRAPKNSNALLEAYFGRSSLLFHTKNNYWPNCSIDIDICLALDNGAYESRLKEMKAECLFDKQLLEYGNPSRNTFIENFFTIQGKTQKQVPSVSAAVDFIIKDGRTKIIAQKYIPLGTLVALETAYVGLLNPENQIRACHYCHAFSLNLIPCDNCNYALFCNEECKRLCYEEYHDVECHIIHVFHVLCAHNLLYWLSVKAAIKLKKKCTWEEFKIISSHLGVKKMNSSLINEVYDLNNKLSILNVNTDKHFVFGTTYNAIFIYATIIHYLESVPSFFPSGEEKADAIRSLGRVLLHLNMTMGTVAIETSLVNSTAHDKITNVPEKNVGVFSFTSKLKHSCDSNLYVVGLNNKVALIALKPIKPGDELTISHVGHWYEHTYKNRTLHLFTKTQIRCQCVVCVEWGEKNLRNAKMNNQQKKSYNNFNFLKAQLFLEFAGMNRRTETLYKESCSCLTAFSDQPNTKEHYELFQDFKEAIEYLQCIATNNKTLLEPFRYPGTYI